MIHGQIIICGGTRCLLNDSKNIRKEIEKELKEHGLEDEIVVLQTGCFGKCQQGPVVKLFQLEVGIVNYFHVTVNDCKRIVEETIIKHNILEDLFINAR